MEKKDVLVYEDEIDLKELFKILTKEKNTILFVVIICLFASIVYVKFQPTQYSATSTLKLGNVDLNLNNSNPNEDIYNYIYELKSNEVLNRTIEQLELKNETGEYISVGTFSQNLAIDIISEEIEGNTDERKILNYLTIKYIGDNPNEAKRIVNTFSEIATEQISTKDGLELNKSLKLVNEQLKREEQNLKEKSDAIINYLKTHKSIHEIKKNINNYQIQVDSISSGLISLNLNIEINQKTLSELKEYINLDYESNIKEMKFNLNSGDISEEDVSFSNNVNFPLILTNVKYTNIRNSLIVNEKTKEVKEKKLKEYKELLLENQLLLYQEEYKFTTLSKELERAKEKYEVYSNKEKAIVERAALDLGNTTVSIISSAIVVPVKSNKQLILLISLVLGTFIGIAIAFFKEFIANNKS